MAKRPIDVTSLRHKDATRRNIPTAEYEPMLREEDRSPIRLAYERRNRDLDPQLVWRGKDEQDWSDLIVQAPPLYIQEKVHPQVLIEDLKRMSRARAEQTSDQGPDLFADFNGLSGSPKATEFYRHDQHWSNRMILGDSLAVMASLAEREGLRGQVQCIYLDPPYGIRFNSNFQWSTTSRDVKDGARDHVTREPEQVRAFRDTWRDGIHSYLTYLRDRLTVARDLLHESGSIFVQIGDENVHRVRALMDEVFGQDSFVAQIQLKKSGGATSRYLPGITDFVCWYARDADRLKFRTVFSNDVDARRQDDYGLFETAPDDWVVFDAAEHGGTDGRRLQLITLTSQRQGRDTSVDSAMGFPYQFRGRQFLPSRGRGWTTTRAGMNRLTLANRIAVSGNSLRLKRYLSDSPSQPTTDLWDDIVAGAGRDKIYVVQTGARVVERCLLMATDPGDLVLDPTCGSGTTAYVAEQWGRRWITIDTSRVALALARSRLMGARYPYYLLADSPEGQKREAEITRSAPKTTPTTGSLRHGFVYERVPHITLKSIANNAEIDVIWEKVQATLEPLRETLNTALGKQWREWEIPREADPSWPAAAKSAHAAWWEARIARQKEIDASIAAKADVEYLYDKPYEDRARIRVAGPFTVESLSPHRTLAVDWNDELIDPQRKGVAEPHAGAPQDFATMILENLRSAGVQQSSKQDRISFTSLTGWPGKYVCAEGRFLEGTHERRAGILIGPEFGTVSRPDLVAAAREAADAGFDILIACAFAYDAHATDFDKLGRVAVLKARMNPDLHMAKDLKATTTGNLFVVFGEPDIDIEPAEGGMLQVRINGVDVFQPTTGQVTSVGKDGIALWMIDTDYNEESFFVRHAYFLGANDPYKALKTTLKAEIDEEAWASLNSDVSRPFPKPASGRIAVKVINHLGDEVI
ncbi:MAG: site-specific DNA-methyltransferase [Burkholderiaceae bacterium]|nr:site-specific DNA-methyltransferase [Burkholderiaceae bacterium]